MSNWWTSLIDEVVFLGLSRTELCSSKGTKEEFICI